MAAFDDSICNISLASFNFDIDESFQRESRPQRRMSMEFMTVNNRSSTPIRSFGLGVHKRKRFNVDQEKNIKAEKKALKRHHEDSNATELFDSFCVIEKNSKKIKTSSSILNIHKVSRKPIKRRSTSKSITTTSRHSLSKSALSASEVSFHGLNCSYLNISAAFSPKNKSFKDTAEGTKTSNLDKSNKNLSQSETTIRASKKRRASDIGIKDIFTSSKRNNGKTKKPSKIPIKKPKAKTEQQSKSPKTLSELLSTKIGLIEFRNFLQSEFSEENLDFWIECEIYKHQRNSKQKKLANVIYEKYIAPRAAREVNLNYETKRRAGSSLVNPQTETFDEAQKEIFILMETDSFQRFLATKISQNEKLYSADNKINVVRTLLNNGRRRLSL